MGIPKFYRWLSERYPLVNMSLAATESPPPLDNLYLDMNGIIHQMSHGNDPNVRLTEEEMVARIFAYLDRIVTLIRPRRLLYMAIDGVAPRAKMNQQRSRRFKTAREREELQAARVRSGEATAEEAAAAFDSNCITPGTAFMARLGRHLRFFVRKRMSEDSAWQSPAVVLSGHDVPGEGEHKIMEHVRWQRSQPGYEPNQTHCMYGLDADLIMLSLVTHEPHFCLLREVVQYGGGGARGGGGGGRGQPSRETLENPCAESFILFQVGLLRECWELEFAHLATPGAMSFPLDLERVVDDFVLMCMLVGNDFLPPLPTLDINEGALNRLLDTYRGMLPQLGGYLTHAGRLDHGRLERLLRVVAEAEAETLADRAADAEQQEQRSARRGGGGGRGRPGGGGGGFGGGGGEPGGAPAAANAPANGRQPRGGGPVAAARGGGGAAASVTVGGAFEALAGAGEEVEEEEENDDGDTATTTAARPGSSGVGREVAVVEALLTHVPPCAAAALGGLEDDDEGGNGNDAGLGAAAAAAAAAAPAEGPTMMSREARALFRGGDSAAALAAWRDRYYREKLEVYPSAASLAANGNGNSNGCASADRANPNNSNKAAAEAAAVRSVVEEYIRGLHWVLAYYYRGVPSWEWYYPHHYAPMASDCVDLQSVAVTFAYGKPFTPFEQLLAVLPPASQSLLPAPFRPFMTDRNSPIVDFYPTEFRVDMEGKRADWEGVVMVPFVDAPRLRAAASSVPRGALTAEERRRERLGDVLVFRHVRGAHEQEHCATTLPNRYGAVAHAHSVCKHVPPPPPLPVDLPGFLPTPPPGTVSGRRNPPGFPTLKTIRGLTGDMRMAGVAVFGPPSKKASLVVTLPADALAPLGGAAATAEAVRAMVGERCYVKWPYLQEAVIAKASDKTGEIAGGGGGGQGQQQQQGQQRQQPWSGGDEAGRWLALAGATRQAFLTKMGVDTGPVPVLLHVRACTGYSRRADGTVVRRHAADLAPYPLQAVLRERPRPGAGAAGAGAADADAPPPLPLQEGARALFLGPDYYGCVATIARDPSATTAAARRSGAPQQQPQGYVVRIAAPPAAGGAANAAAEAAAAAARLARRLVSQHQTHYLPAHAAARQVGASSRALGRMSGSVWVSLGGGESRVDVGLCVRNGKEGTCVPGFAVPMPSAGGPGGFPQWVYSRALVALAEEYHRRFPWVWKAVENQDFGGSRGGGGGGGPGGGGGGASSSSSSSALTLATMMPNEEAGRRAETFEQLRRWLKGLPSAKRPLVPTSVRQASDEAVAVLQASFPMLQPRGGGAGAGGGGAVIELESVHPALLLPPYDPAQPASELAGGVVELGDRVAVIKATGQPPFGSRGTVIGVHESPSAAAGGDGGSAGDASSSAALEVLMDRDFVGGTTLGGRVSGQRGAYVPAHQVLNLSRVARVPLPASALRAVPLSAATAAELSAAAPPSPRAAAATAPESPTAAGKAGKAGKAAAAVFGPSLRPLADIAPWARGVPADRLAAAKKTAAAGDLEDLAGDLAVLASAASARQQQQGAQQPRGSQREQVQQMQQQLRGGGGGGGGGRGWGGSGSGGRGAGAQTAGPRTLVPVGGGSGGGGGRGAGAPAAPAMPPNAMGRSLLARLQAGGGGGGGRAAAPVVPSAAAPNGGGAQLLRMLQSPQPPHPQQQQQGQQSGGALLQMLQRGAGGAAGGPPPQHQQPSPHQQQQTPPATGRHSDGPKRPDGTRGFADASAAGRGRGSGGGGGGRGAAGGGRGAGPATRTFVPVCPASGAGRGAPRAPPPPAAAATAASPAPAPAAALPAGLNTKAAASPAPAPAAALPAGLNTKAAASPAPAPAAALPAGLNPKANTGFDALLRSAAARGPQAPPPPPQQQAPLPPNQAAGGGSAGAALLAKLQRKG